MARQLLPLTLGQVEKESRYLFLYLSIPASAVNYETFEVAIPVISLLTHLYLPQRASIPSRSLADILL